MALGIDSIGLLFLFITLGASPLMVWLFRPEDQREAIFRSVARIVRDYWAHLGLFGVLYFGKGYVDNLNDPIRGVFGDFTFLIHRLEGDVVLLVQQAFQHPWLTDVLNANYLFAYIFLTYFSFILAAYADDRDLANKFVLTILTIYLIAIPFYIFFNVQITSDYIPGMHALLYHSSADYLAFFTRADPLDNAWPSLHIGIPFGLLVLLVWTVRGRGQTISSSGYERFFWLVTIETGVFAFSILYLGIHWILDIPGGLLVGYMGALIVEEIHDDVFGAIYGFGDRVRAWMSTAWRRLREGLGRSDA